MLRAFGQAFATTPQSRKMISLKKEDNRAARATSTSVHFFAVLHTAKTFFLSILFKYMHYFENEPYLQH